MRMKVNLILFNTVHSIFKSLILWIISHLAKPCPPLATPKFGYTIPLSCSSTGTTQGKECYMYCDEGFILAGATTYKCDRQTYDQNPSKALCTKSKSLHCLSLLLSVFENVDQKYWFEELQRKTTVKKDCSKKDGNECEKLYLVDTL